MKVVGLCGGSGSGKSVVAGLLSEYGFAHIDTDKIYHDLTDRSSPCLDDLVAEFGKGIINETGGLDRTSLAEIVFNSPNKDELRKTLNRIAHRHVLDSVRELLPRLKAEGFAAALVDAPLLFESGFDKECDYNAGGARWNWSTVNFPGSINVIESMLAVRELIFEKKLYTAAEFISKLDAEDPILYKRLKKCPHYGCGNEEADKFACEFTDKIFASADGKPLPYGEFKINDRP